MQGPPPPQLLLLYYIMCVLRSVAAFPVASFMLGILCIVAVQCAFADVVVIALNAATASIAVVVSLYSTMYPP